MKKKLAGIADFVGKDTMLILYRKLPNDLPLEGFVVAVSEKLLLLHIVDGISLLLNGYCVLPLSIIRSYRVDESFVSRALRLLGRKPVIPEGIELSSWKDLVASVKDRHSFLLFELEKREPGAIFIGPVIKQTARYVALRKVDSKGKWYEKDRFPFKDLTKIEFDNGYVNALSQLVAYEDTLP